MSFNFWEELANRQLAIANPVGLPRSLECAGMTALWIAFVVVRVISWIVIVGNHQSGGQSTRYSTGAVATAFKYPGNSNA